MRLTVYELPLGSVQYEYAPEPVQVAPTMDANEMTTNTNIQILFIFLLSIRAKHLAHT